jgi:hypothetical protein
MAQLKPKLALIAIALCSASVAGAAEAAAKPPPLRNPALLNIGFVCRWQDRCIERQENAMVRALKYVKKHQPPAWKVQLCNRNAGRNGTRVDWIGFNNCIRNPALRPPPRKRRR